MLPCPRHGCHVVFPESPVLGSRARMAIDLLTQTREIGEEKEDE